MGVFCLFRSFKGVRVVGIGTFIGRLGSISFDLLAGVQQERLCEQFHVDDVIRV